MFLEISQNSQENTCARVSFLIKLRPATLLKKRLWQRCFCINFAKFLRTPFLQDTSGRLLLFRYIYFGKSAVKVLIKYRGSNWYYDASANSTSQSGECHENKCFNNDKFKSLKEPNLSGRTFCGNENQSPKVLFWKVEQSLLQTQEIRQECYDISKL